MTRWICKKISEPTLLCHEEIVTLMEFFTIRCRKKSEKQTEGGAIRAPYSSIKAPYSSIKVPYSSIRACYSLVRKYFYLLRTYRSLLTEKNKFPPWE